MTRVISYPTGVLYREALYDTRRAFRDPALRGGEQVLDQLGMPKAIGGNFASVFTINGTDGNRWAVKCFTRKPPEGHPRPTRARYPEPTGCHSTR